MTSLSHELENEINTATKMVIASNKDVYIMQFRSNSRYTYIYIYIPTPYGYIGIY